MAYEKQNWTTKTPITPEALNHIEDGIANSIDLDSNQTIEGTKTFEQPVSLNGAPTENNHAVRLEDVKINYIDNQEIATNEYINDKRIYVKKFNETISTYRTDEWTDWIDVSSLNIDKIVKIYGEMEDSNSVTPFPNTENATHYVCVCYFKSSNNLQIIGTGYQNRQVTLFIEYTKN